jgi:hypothetical protein
VTFTLRWGRMGRIVRWSGPSANRSCNVATLCVMKAEASRPPPMPGNSAGARRTSK